MPKKIDFPVQRKAQIRDALRETGLLIAAARKQKGWSQSDLGQRLGDIDRRHVSAMERGDPNASIGLVVAALWLLDLPLLATLPEAGRSAASRSFFTGVGLPRVRRNGTKWQNHPDEIDNDF